MAVPKLSNLKIRWRVLLVGAMPLVAFIWIAGIQMMAMRAEMQSEERVMRLAEFTPAMSAVVHELQKERGMSAGFLGSKGARFTTELPRQRATTDAAIKAFGDAVATVDPDSAGLRFRSALTEARGTLEKLKGIRGQVSALEIGVPDMAGYYTSAIGRVLNTIEIVGELAAKGDVVRGIAAYTAILQGKERAGQERAMGATGFSAGAFAPDIHEKFVRLGAMQDSLFQQFRAYATAEEIAELDRVTSGTAVADYERMVKIAVASAYGGVLEGVTGPEWFAASTGRIDALKLVEDRLAHDLVALSREHLAEASAAFRRMLAVVVMIGLLVFAVAMVVVRSIVTPIRKLEADMGQLAQGHLDMSLAGHDRRDEIGDMTRAVAVFRDNERERVRLLSQSEAEREARETRQHRIDELISGFRGSMRDVITAVGANTAQMQSSAASMTGVAEDTAQRATLASDASMRASSNVQNVAAATAELTSSIAEISRQITQTTEVVGRATASATDSNVKVASLAEAANRIGDVISLIEDIAEQTNLLALNATIEAARAGEMGKGFAVVASEVKMLANQTANATTEIAQQIADIQSSSADAARAIGEIASTMTDVSEYTNAIAAAVEEQGAATQEISDNVQRAADGTDAAASNMEGVNDAVGKTRISAEEVLQASADVAEQAKHLRAEVDEFLDAVAAA